MLPAGWALLYIVMYTNDIKLVSHNVGGLGSYQKATRFVSHVLYPKFENSPDIICLQETHFSPSMESGVLAQFQYDCAFSHGGEGREQRSGGLLIGFKRRLDYTLHDMSSFKLGRTESHCFMVYCTVQGTEMVIVNSYTNPRTTTEERRLFWLQIGIEVSQFGCPNIICCGDFNTVLNPKMDTTSHRGEVRAEAAFQEFVDTMEWADIFRVFNPISRRVTRHDTRTLAGSRLDYIFMSGFFLNYVSEVKILLRTVSDHNPVQVSFSLQRNDKGRGYWKFPDAVLNNEKFTPFMKSRLQECINRHKDSVPGNLLWETVKCVARADLAEFLKTDGLEDKIQNETFQTRLKRLYNARDEAAKWSTRKKFNDEIVECTQEWDVFTERVNKKRLDFNVGRRRKEAEKSSKYFFKKYNAIPASSNMMYNSKSEPCYADVEILDVCHKFYSNLYNQPPSGAPHRFQFITHDPTHRIDSNAQDLLSEEITLDELHNALKGMKNGKAPGMDGYTVAFMKTFWEEIGPLVLASFQCAMTSKLLANSQRKGVIKLLPKRDKNPHFVHNLRPIVLLNLDLKIFTRALSLRLKKMVDDLVEKDQHGFIKGRFIGNAVLDLYSIATEAINQDDDTLIMSLDIYKAFDSVAWPFLYDTLRSFGIPEIFIDWIKLCYNKKDLVLFNNGHASKPIRVNNGLPQGCSLSPVLFILCMETLATVIRNNPKIKGISVNGEGEKKIGLVADDTVLTIKASSESFREVVGVLEDFERQSGLRINYEKSIVCTVGRKGTNLSMESRGRFVWLKGNEAFKYLGLTLRFYNATGEIDYGENWNFAEHTLLESIKKLRYARHSLLGKILLIKTMLASKFVYKLSLLPTPSTAVLKRLNKFYYNYLWGNRQHQISAATMELDISAGGYNMLSVYMQEQSLKFIWLQRLFHDTTICFWQLQVISCFTIPVLRLLNLNITHRKFHKFIKRGKILPQFWIRLFEAWFKIRYISASDSNPSFGELLQRPVCFITAETAQEHSRMMEYMTYLEQKGVVTLEQFLRAKDTLCDDDVVTWLVRHLPTTWLLINIDAVETTQSLYDGVLVKKWTVKQIHAALRSRSTHQPHAPLAWAKDFNMDNVQELWINSYKSSAKLTDPRVRAFAFKFLHRAFFLNARLARFTDQVPLCSFCHLQPETFTHIMWDCSLVSSVRDKLFDFCAEYAAVEQSALTKMSFFFPSFRDSAVNIILLLFKRHLLNVRFSIFFDGSTAVPDFHKFLLQLRKYIRTDRLAYQYAKKDRLFYGLWGTFAYEEFLLEWDDIF